MKKVKFISLAFAQIEKVPQNIISIGDRGEPYNFSCEHKRILRLEFDDVTQHIDNSYHLFDYSHARKILEFVRDCGNEDILIHCHAGVSRSAAVAKFLNDHRGYFLDLSYPSLNTTSGFNSEVYRILFHLHMDLKTRFDVV